MALLVGIVSVLTFSPLLHCDLLYGWDDGANLVENHLIEKLDWPHISAIFADTGQSLRYKPLTWVTCSLIYSICGLQPWGYHLVNVLFHGANAALLVLLFHQILRQGGLLDKSGNYTVFCAGAFALLWAWHPLRVEPVAWVTAIPYGQATFFFLVSLLFYLKAHEVPSGRRAGLYWVSVICFAASLLTYPIALMGVCVLVVLDFYPLKLLKREDLLGAGRQSVWLHKLPYVILAALIFVMTLIARSSFEGHWTRPAALAHFGILQRAAQAFYVWAVFVWRTAVPVKLSPLYTDLLVVDPLAVQFLVSFAAVISITVATFVMRKRWPVGCVCWLCFLILSVPALGLTEHPHFANDRYTYLPGISLVAIIGVVLLRSQYRRLALGIAIAIALTFAVSSVRQLAIWHDEIALYSQLLKELPNSPTRARMNSRMAEALTRKHRNREAVAFYREALAINPDDIEGYENLGDAYFELNESNAAKDAYREALRRAPDDIALRNRFAFALAMRNLTAEAQEEFERAIALAPKYAASYQNLGVLLKQQGRIEEAQKYFNMAEAVRHSADEVRDASR